MTLPLPERDSTIGNRWQDHLSLVPFQDIAAYWEGKPFGVATIFGFFRSFALWQVLFNILLTVPFSVYLRYYFKQSLLRATVLSFGLSLFFELTQLSALYGFYPGPYRLAAVEGSDRQHHGRRGRLADRLCVHDGPARPRHHR